MYCVCIFQIPIILVSFLYKDSDDLNFLFRTKIDWNLPPCQNADSAIKEIANIYLEGDKDRNLPRHAVPILGDRAKFKREGNVMHEASPARRCTA